MDINPILRVLLSHATGHPVPGTGPYHPVIDVLPGDQPVPPELIDRGNLGGAGDLLGLIEQLYPGGDTDSIERNFLGLGGKKPAPKPGPQGTPGITQGRDPKRPTGGIFGGGGYAIGGKPAFKFVNPHALQALQVLAQRGHIKL